MKTQMNFRASNYLKLLVLIISLIQLTHIACAQKATIGILYIEGKGVIPDAQSLGSMARIEMEKLNVYNVVDWFDIKQICEANQIDLNNCLGKTCVLEAGKALHADKMLLGSIERFDERIAIILKIVDVKTGNVEKSNTVEFQNLQSELQRMIEISEKMLLGRDPDPKAVEALLAYSRPVNTRVTKVNLSGPRIGMYYTDGIAGERMRADKTDHGGLGMYAVSSFIGWQQEVQYLSTGDFECIFEFLFTGAGLESGRFIPAFTFLNGFRLANIGVELAIGPTFRFIRKADGYYDKENFDSVDDWHLESEWTKAHP